MRHVLLLLCGIALLLPLVPSTASAQTAAQELGTCLADHTTGKDRKNLARWIFSAMAAHPDIKSMSAVTDEQREEISREVGTLFTRLLTESCSNEAPKAVEGERPVIGDGFEILGKVAMQELMRNEDVSKAMQGIISHIDVERIQEVLQPK